jgi:hypothetical protein
MTIRLRTVEEPNYNNCTLFSFQLAEIDIENVGLLLDKKGNTLSATGSKNAPNADPNLI